MRGRVRKGEGEGVRGEREGKGRKGKERAGCCALRLCNEVYECRRG